jgi:phenylacetate-CoA ligase
VASFQERLYLRSPIWLQQIAVAAWGVGWFRRRYNREFHRYVQEFHDRDFWSAQQFREYQSTRLAQILEAAASLPYYRDVFAQVGIARNTDPWESISRMPLLTKATLRASGKAMLTQSRLPRGTHPFMTSGTSGTPLSVYYTTEFHALHTAVCEARNLNIGGVTYLDRRFMCGGRKVCAFQQNRPPFWRISPWENLAYASCYHLSPQFLPSYLDFLERFRPVVISGYPSALYNIARFALDRHRLPPPARCIITVAETVTPDIRETIETAWQCRVFDRYGSVEGVHFAGQCEHGRYHVSPEIGIVEIVDANGQPVPPGSLGEVVCTGLHNTLQPLIRYRLGDMARWAINQDCSCGRHTPIIEGIEGRVEDMCITPDGRQMLRFHAVVKGVATVKVAQIVQERLDRFVIYVVPTEGFSPRDVEIIKENMRLHVGNVTTCVECVDHIDRTASGKFRAVVCKLSAEERRRAGGLANTNSP